MDDRILGGTGVDVLTGGLGQLRIGPDADSHTALFGSTTGTLVADFPISFDNNAES